MTTIVVCADHGTPAKIAVDGTTVISAPELCWRPGQLSELVPKDETSLLLALHGSEADSGRVQAALRRMGFDALGVGVLDLERFDDDHSIGHALAALKARGEHYPGSQPEQVKLVHRPARTTRRSLLSFGVPTYAGAPMIDKTTCRAEEGCRLCVTNCPAEALAWEGGTVAYDKTACVGCGICITTCPTGAVVNPVATPEAIEAEIRAAVAASNEPIGIRFLCRNGRISHQPGWHDVEVPCTGMLTIGWLLGALVVGASAVIPITCAESGCDVGLSARTTAVLAEAAKVLAAFGLDTARLAEPSHAGPIHAGPIHDRPLTPPSSSGVFATGSTHRAIAALHESARSEPGFIALGQVDIGTIEINADSCTACEMCANICPTDAVDSRHEPQGVHIDFDPRQCVACGQCITSCPEIDRGAISLATGFDVADWNEGRREIRHDTTASCELCGRPVAPSAMLERVSAILGVEHSGTVAVIARRCIDCRGR